MKKREIVLDWRRQLKEWGGYDNSLGGEQLLKSKLLRN